MYKTINQYDFTTWFSKSDTYKNNFTYSGLIALFEYLEEYEEDTGEKIEFDPIALCCEYSEYGSAVDAIEDYSHDTLVDEILRTEDEDEKEKQALEWLQERTQVIVFDDNTKDGRGIIIQQF